MEQKEIIGKFYIKGVMTLEKLLRMLYNLSTDKVNSLLEHHLPLKGEVGVYKLLNSSDPVTSEFLGQKIDVQKAKAYFEQQSLPFAFKEDTKGVQVYYKVKNKPLAHKAVENIFKHISSDPGGFAQATVQKPGQQSFDQKVAQIKPEGISTGMTQGVEKKIPGKGL
ncbi:hypothetical protein ACI1TM_08605 [Lactococcus garvieae]|uniref:hypothetical protein n=1 Tax=Lactococcus garvieae TaxID=1363 RepID=UPI0038535EBD